MDDPPPLCLFMVELLATSALLWDDLKNKKKSKCSMEGESMFFNTHRRKYKSHVGIKQVEVNKTKQGRKKNIGSVLGINFSAIINGWLICRKISGPVANLQSAKKWKKKIACISTLRFFLKTFLQAKKIIFKRKEMRWKTKIESSHDHIAFFALMNFTKFT